MIYRGDSTGETRVKITRHGTRGLMNKRTLVILLHAYTRGPESLTHVENEIRRSLESVEILKPALPLSRLSTARPDAIVASLLQTVDHHWETGGYDRIILVGHSAGALLARKLYIAACGSHEMAPLEQELLSGCARPRAWAAHVERLVLLAGMNNGWSIDYHMSLSRALQYSVGVVFAQVLYLLRRRWPVIFQIRRGAPFLTELRIQWLLMRRDAEARGIGQALVVQLLGTVDDLVSPQDNMDLVTGRDFFFLDVPGSGHASVLEMDDSEIGRQRAAILHNALIWSKPTLETNSAPVEEVNPVMVRDDVEEVVFVIHGIRDEGYWTDKIAREIVMEGRAAERVFARETSTYGYFGMLPFLSPWKRRQKVEWLMDKYAEAIARYPKATKFHYVGHSNGTYLLARALRDYRCCRFCRVVFAGSVVPSRYDWKSLQESHPPKVQEILNYVATADWVVAFFPNCFEYLRIPDIGGAGHRGFTQLDNAASGSLSSRNIRYVVGQHSAAIKERNWRALAHFVVHGHSEQGDPPGVPESMRHEILVGIFGRCPPLVWLALFAVLLSVPLLLFLGYMHYHWQQWLVTTLLIAYCSLVWYVGNRV
jgi:pimeloyl-ACP methyl ester carboxylesterase